MVAFGYREIPRRSDLIDGEEPTGKWLRYLEYSAGLGSLAVKVYLLPDDTVFTSEDRTAQGQMSTDAKLIYETDQTAFGVAGCDGDFQLVSRLPSPLMSLPRIWAFLLAHVGGPAAEFVHRGNLRVRDGHVKDASITSILNSPNIPKVV